MKNKIIPYLPHLVSLARQNRNNPTAAEKKLWQYLKGKKVEGTDFHRQKPMLSYILDFYCPNLQIAIELDGSSHDKKESYDMKRQSEIEAVGVYFLRFTNEQVFQELDSVITAIEQVILMRKEE
jgi:very-short-patch-repair endonuclease